MQFAVLNNLNISSEPWVYRMDVDEFPRPFFIAKIHVFGSQLSAKEFLQDEDGVLVPGKPWALTFAGVMDSTRVRVTADFLIEVREFLEACAQFLAQKVFQPEAVGA